MLEHFFMSRTRIELLTLFLTNPDRDYYVRELAQHTGITLPSISKEVRNLHAADFIKASRRGKSIFYTVNKEHLLYPEMKSIIYKTTALGDSVREHLKEIPRIDAAIIYGSIAKDREHQGSDIDILILGTPDESILYDVCAELENKSRREINFVTFSPEEWQDKIAHKDNFALQVMNSKMIPLMGDIHVLSASH